MCDILSPDTDDPNRFTGFYDDPDGDPPGGIAAAYHPQYSYNLAPYLSSQVVGNPTPGYVVEVDASNWPSYLRPAPVQVYFKANQCWAVLDIPA